MDFQWMTFYREFQPQGREAFPQHPLPFSSHRPSVRPSVRPTVRPSVLFARGGYENIARP